MATSFENQYIDESYQKVVQISGSLLADGTGSVITNLDLTASNAVSASYAVSASVEITKEISSSYADNAGTAISASHAVQSNNATTAALATSASYIGGAQVDGQVAQAGVAGLANLVYGYNVAGAVTSSISASFAATASLLLGSVVSASRATSAASADTATSSSHALQADSSLTSVSASHSQRADLADTATQATTATSASHALQADNALTATSATTATTASNANYATSASRAISAASADTATSATTATSASHAVQADSSLTAISSSHAVASDTSISSSFASTTALAFDANDLIIGVKNTLGVTITKGQTLHATGVTGENIDVITSSNANGDMPAIGLASADINAGAAGNAIISGRLIGFNTNGFVAGENVYVGIDGGLTQTKPTGSALIQNIGIVGKVDATDGELVVLGAGRSNDVPNIAHNNVWLGDANGVAQAVVSSSLKVDDATTAQTASIATSASHAVRSDIADGLATTARINIADITASNASFTSASIGYLRTTTGSATIIGDEYIILNADSPTQRYAGIKVYDSGSGLTGSFEWDSVDDNWLQVATDGTAAGFLTGISGSKGSEAYPANNTIVKGTGNHTVKDSSIVDDGTKVSTTLPISASAGVTASLHGNADTATLATNATNATSASHALQADNATTASYATNADNWNGIFTGSASMTGSLTVNGDTLLSYKTAPNFTRKDIVTFPSFTKSASPGNGQTFAYNAFNYFNIPVAGTVNNVFQIAQGNDSDLSQYGSYLNVGGARSDLFLLASGSDTDAKKTATISVLDDGDSTYAGNAVARYYGTTIEIGQYNSRDIQIGNGMNGGTGYDTRTIQTSAENMYIGAAPGLSFAWKNGTNNYSGNPTKDIEFWYTGSATFHQTSSIVSPAIVVSGSVASHVQDLTIASTTASLNCNTGDVFRLTLANNANTHLVATNINPGQVITIKVKNNATAAGTLSFNSEFAFAGGTAPTVTATVNAEDIITFQSFDSSKLYGTSVLNLS